VVEGRAGLAWAGLAWAEPCRWRAHTRQACACPCWPCLSGPSQATRGLLPVRYPSFGFCGFSGFDCLFCTCHSLYCVPLTNQASPRCYIMMYIRSTNALAALPSMLLFPPSLLPGGSGLFIHFDSPKQTPKPGMSLPACFPSCTSRVLLGFHLPGCPGRAHSLHCFASLLSSSPH